MATIERNISFATSTSDSMSLGVAGQLSKMSRHFHVVDYVVFVVSLVGSVGVGVYHSLRRPPTAGPSPTSFLLADRDLHVVPLTISLVVSLVSAVTLLGLPAEMYTHGSQYVFNFGSGLGILLTALIFVPLLHPLRLTSMFEYLELRFESRAARLTGSVLEVLALLLYGGTALFAPAVALSGITPLPMWALVTVLGALVTVYTCAGGLRGVVWADVFQAIVMVTGVVTVLGLGWGTVGGVTDVWELNKHGDRLHFYNFDLDPRTRHTFWGLTVGFCFGGLSFYGASQFTFQRFTAARTLRAARLTVLLNLPLFYMFHFLLCGVGLVIYAYYSTLRCDPIAAGHIHSANQLLPLYVMDTVGHIPGLPGLFVAALTSGALSTISSVMNSVAALVWDDFLRPVLKEHVSPRRAVMVTRLLVVVSGAIIVGLSFLSSSFGPHIFQVCFALLGASGGPQLGMFLLGALVPWANSKGAISGCLVGTALTAWITIGAFITKPPQYGLPPAPTNQCIPFPVTTNHSLPFPTTDSSHLTTFPMSDAYTTLSTQSDELNITESLALDEYGLRDTLYSLSYTWYTLLGSLTCVLVGMLVSVITGPTRTAPNLVMPLARRLWGCGCHADDTPDVKDAEVDMNEALQPLKMENDGKTPVL